MLMEHSEFLLTYLLHFGSFLMVLFHNILPSHFIVSPARPVQWHQVLRFSRVGVKVGIICSS